MRYFSSSKSSTSVLDTNKSPFNHAESTSAPAFGDEAKQPECIFTPQGIPMTGISDFPSDSNTEIISLVVPSPPAYTSKSIFDSINKVTNSEVSETVVISED